MPLTLWWYYHILSKKRQEFIKILTMSKNKDKWISKGAHL